MFQDTLLIIKNDYIHRRKCLLVYLLKRGFQIQGRRRIIFSPELAAEFYQDKLDDPCFMFQVILLSKGASEAFILAKEHAVQDLINSLVCYFGTSVEMDRNVHATRCLGKVRKDITFIFPNYIFEPILCPHITKICPNNPFVTSIVHKVYDISMHPDVNPHRSWEVKLAEWLLESNKNEPNVSNQCAINPSVNVCEAAQQTKETSFTAPPDVLYNFESSKSSAMALSSGLDLSSSSCLTCSDFASCDDSSGQDHLNFNQIVDAKSALLEVIESSSSSAVSTHVIASAKALKIVGDYADCAAIKSTKSEEMTSDKPDLFPLDRATSTSTSDPKSN